MLILAVEGMVLCQDVKGLDLNSSAPRLVIEGGVSNLRDWT